MIRQFLRDRSSAIASGTAIGQEHGVIGAALEVHRVLGTGFLELLYKDALEIELNARHIPLVVE